MLGLGLLTAAAGGFSGKPHCRVSPGVCPCPGWLASPSSDLAPSFLLLWLASHPMPTHEASECGKGGETLGPAALQDKNVEE